MMNQEQIDQALHTLIDDFVGERAYEEIFKLAPVSQGILFQMQSNLVNAKHIWGDVLTTADPAVRKLSITICERNLQTFIEAAAAARELYLILPNHLIDYQDRAEKIKQAVNQMLTPG